MLLNLGLAIVLNPTIPRHGKIFHPQHCLMLRVKARLTKAYGTEEGFLRHQMDQEDIERKLEVGVAFKPFFRPLIVTTCVCLFECPRFLRTQLH